MLPSLAAGVATARRRRLLQAWVERVGVHAQVALIAAGVVALLLRALAGWERDEALVLIAPAALALFTAYLVARRSVPSAASLTAWLDVRAGGQGRVVTERELGSSAWSEEAAGALATALRDLPRPRWKRALRAAAPAAAFAALAAWVPIPRPALGPPPIVTATAIAELEEKLATLEETIELEPEVAEELEARLERIASESAEGRPASTFEAMDRLGERLDAEAARALDAARRANRDLASAARDPSLADAQAALDAALSRMDEAGLGRELPASVENALQPGSLALPAGVQLSSAELVQLSRELRGVMDARLGKLAAGRMLDPRELRELRLGEPGEGEADPTHECDEACKKPGGT